MKKFLAVACTSLMLVASLAVEAEAGKKTRRVATGIIIGAGIATILGAAAAAAQEDEGEAYYDYRPVYSERDNAIAACLHRSHRLLQRRGFDGTELRRVRSVRPVGSASLRVNLALLSYEDGYPEPVNVTCRVFRGRVSNISFG